MVAVAPDVAAKLAVLEAFAAAGIAKSDLGGRVGAQRVRAERGPMTGSGVIRRSPSIKTRR
jgi:hypothetical protein